MTRKRIVIYGAGGHGKLVADVLLAQGKRIDCFVDDNSPSLSETVLDFPVYSSSSLWRAGPESTAIVLGVGNNWARKKIAERCTQAGLEILTVIHPTAIISRRVSIGLGTAIMAKV